MKLGRSAILGFLMTVASVGCGSSGSGNRVDATAATASCNAYCDMYGAAACPSPALYASADECKQLNCVPLPTAPATCQAPLKTYYDCEKTQADICVDKGCLDQSKPLETC